jgi:hypothetical protein
MTSDNKYAELVRHFDKLPDDAVVPTPVTAAVHGVSERTVRRTCERAALAGAERTKSRDDSQNVSEREARHLSDQPPRGSGRSHWVSSKFATSV